MKKIFLSLALFFVLVPSVGLAATVKTDTCSAGVVKSSVAALFPTKFCSAGDLITIVVKTLLAFISMIAVVVIILGGYKYVTSSGNAENAGAARKQITYAITGLVVAVLAYTVVAVVSNTVGSSTSNTTTGSTAGTGGNGSSAAAQTAARNHLIAATTVLSTDPTPSQNYVKFDVTVKANPADIAAICPDHAETAKVTSTIGVPLGEGDQQVTRDYTSDQYGLNPNEALPVAMHFTTESNPIDKPVTIGGKLKISVEIDLDTGCQVIYDFQKDADGIDSGI